MTRQFRIGNILLGGGAPVTVQTMTNTRTADFDATYAQVLRLAEAGSDVVRVTLNEHGAVQSFKRLCQSSPVPIVADIHFDYRLALAAVEAGAQKIRINPGNLSNSEQVRMVAEACIAAGIGIRIGVNAGSLPQDACGDSTAERMADAALKQAAMVEQYGLIDVCLSVKSSDVQDTFDAYRLLHDRCDYPLHLGVTEAGLGDMALAKTNACVGGLLLAGIGDTIRVSLTDDPIKEVEAGIRLLRAVGLRRDFVNVIACPTCGRTQYDVIGTATRLTDMLSDVRKPLTVAVMGCVVNGLGEGAHADFGVAGGKDRSILFAHGKQLATVPNDQVEQSLVSLIKEAIDG